MMKLYQVAFDEDHVFFVEAATFDKALELGRKALGQADGFDHSEDEPAAVAVVHEGEVVREEDFYGVG